MVTARTEWLKVARPNQITPPNEWFGWLLLAGRGFGKTRVGAEDAWWHTLTMPGNVKTAVVAPTGGDVRRTCYEGESGLLNVVPEACMWEGQLSKSYNRAFHELKLSDGSIMQGFGATEPERLRGPQFGYAWADELAAWATQNTVEAMQQTWDMLMFGLRLGKYPKVVVTTTPKPFPLIIELVNRVGHDFVMTSGSTYENRANLAPSFFNQVIKYEGTKLGDQEIHAKVLDLEEGGIFKRSDFKLWPYGQELPYFEYIVQSYDTAYTAKTINDPTACTTWGVFKLHGKHSKNQEHGVVLLDAWQDYMEFPELRQRAFDEFHTYYGQDQVAIDPHDHTLLPGTMKRPLIGKGSDGRVGRKPDIVLIEAIGGGINLQAELDRKGVPTMAYNPGKADKAERAHVVSHIPPAALVFVPESENKRGTPVSWSEGYAIPTMCQSISMGDSTGRLP